MSRCHSSTDVLSALLLERMPALLTRVSTLPCSLRMVSQARFHGDRTAYIHDQGRSRVADVPRLFLQPVGGDVHHQDAVPVGNQLASHGGAEDASGAGDNREPFIVHRHHSAAGRASRPR